MDSQIFIGGYGHSGTRVIAMILERAGYYLGKNKNQVWDVTDYKRVCYGFERKYRPQYSDKTKLPFKKKDKQAITQFKRITQTNAIREPWALKYGTFFRALPLIFQTYPKAKFVMTVRHGMDQILRFPKWAANQKGFNVETVLSPKELAQDRHRRQLLFWGRLYREALDYLESINPKWPKKGARKNWMLIRLEDLCSSPDEEIGRLFKFLNISGSRKRCVELVKHPKTIGERFRKKGFVDRLEGHDYGMLEFFDYEV